jgi:ankyrin repeat protein
MNFHNQHQRLRRLAYKNGSNSGLNGSNSTNSSSSSLGHSRQTLETLIYKASAEGDAETLGKLFEGRDVEFLRECLNYVPPLTNTTPLIVAARNGHAPVVKLLLENGADASQCGSVIFDGDHIRE